MATILIVEKDKDLAGELQGTLIELGHAVTVARSLAEACGSMARPNPNPSEVCHDGKSSEPHCFAKGSPHEAWIRQRLRENEECVTATLACIEDGVIETNEAGLVERMNPAAERLTGWALEEAAGRRVDMVCEVRDDLSHEDVDGLCHPARSVARDGLARALCRHAVLRSRGGLEVPVSGRATPLRDERGVIRGTVLVFRDTTKVRMQELELQATKTRLEHLLNPAIIYARESNGSDAWITFMSEDVMAQLGYEPAVFQNSLHAWSDRIHPDDRVLVGEVWSPSSAGARDGVRGGDGACEYRFLHANGTYRWLHDAFRTIWRSGGPPEFVGRLVDITDRKENELLLARQTRRLERSNKELEEFAYVASHDLRAPLRAIDTLSEWIQTDLGQALHGETGDQMRLLRGRVQRMDRLLSDLLEYARIGREDVATDFVDVRELLVEIVDLLNSPRGVRFEMSEVLPTFETAKVPLKRVLLNLISNSLKHNDRMEGRIQLGVLDRGDWYEFSVQDDGPGVPAKFRERVFQMFQTLRPRDSMDNSGMGLAIVRRIVEGANGRVWVESVEALEAADLGRGVRFVFTWPKLWVSSPISRSTVPPQVVMGTLERTLPQLRAASSAPMKRLR